MTDTKYSLFYYIIGKWMWIEVDISFNQHKRLSVNDTQIKGKGVYMIFNIKKAIT